MSRLATKENILDLENVLQFAAGSSKGDPAVTDALLNHVVGMQWRAPPSDDDEDSFRYQEPEFDSHRLCLMILGEAVSTEKSCTRDVCEMQKLTEILLPQFEKGDLNILRLNVCMISGLRRLPLKVKELVSDTN